MREQMEGIAIAIAPMTIGKKRDKKMKGGKPAKTSYTYSEGGRATYAEGGMTKNQKLKAAADVATERKKEREKPSNSLNNEEYLAYVEEAQEAKLAEIEQARQEAERIAENKRKEGELKLTQEQIARDKYTQDFYNQQYKLAVNSFARRKASGDTEMGFRDRISDLITDRAYEKGDRSPDDAIRNARMDVLGFNEGGEIDSQMAMAMPMPMEETETPMSEEQPLMPDIEMEDEYLDFVISQSLNPEEEAVLMSKLEADPELSVMFDKLMDTATEFSGSGPVEGPGSEVSDSIPARLSDGEFVFTAKATEYIGADRLQSMMEEAQTAADAERQEVALGGVMTEKPQASLLGALPDENINDDDIRKDMRSVNPRLQ